MAEQKRTRPDWEDVQVFLALSRHGSLSAAARALSVNHATIGRRIRSLEASLRVKLVERRPQGYVLTPAGTRALAAASQMEVAAQALGRSDADDGPTGLVRVNAPPALARAFLTSRLARLPVDYPGLDIDLAAELRVVSLERRETDLAVRLGRPSGGDLLARPLATVGYGFYGTVALCRRLGEGAEPAFVGFGEANAEVPEAAWLSRHFPRARVAFRADDQFAQATAARAGVGLALLPHYIGRSLPGLRLCALGPVPLPRPLTLLMRRSDRNVVPVKIVADYLVHVFSGAHAIFDQQDDRPEGD